MKKILLFALILQLTGCALVEKLWVANYDTNEYALVTKVRTLAQSAKSCDESTIKELYVTSLELKNFSEYIPKNKATLDLTSHLFVIVEELNKKESPSPSYCKAKLNTIVKSAETIQQVVGNKPR